MTLATGVAAPAIEGRPRELARPRAHRSVIPFASTEVAWSAAAVVLFAFGIYVRTLLPGPGFWDTAEAQTVPHTLSIFHPTGFPTYALLGWLWSQVPVGEVAYRMNLLSAVCLALASGLVVLIAAHLIDERHRLLGATAAGIGGLTFAFADEPWQNAVRADVHALHIFLAGLIIWLLLCWGAAEHARTAHRGRWLAVAALVFGISMGNHPLTGLMAFGIAAWLVMVDPFFWKRWRLMLACAGLLLLGLATYLYIPIRALTPPEPPLFYARPTTLERMKYLVFAEQFHGLFDNFSNPFDLMGVKWQKADAILARQFIGPGWLLVAIGASLLAVRKARAFIFLGLIVITNVFYSLNFEDGDIDRYYLITILIACVLLAVVAAWLAALCARTVAEASRRTADIRGRRMLARVAGGAVLAVVAIFPSAALVTGYEMHDQSSNRDADRWVESVYRALPQDAVIISWWSYSTPLWYHRWINGERPDVKIMDERNILDDGYGTIETAIRVFLGSRPVYVVPPSWEVNTIRLLFNTEDVPTYPGYTALLHVKESE
ncbi:MAG TPA: DUF2723 domain-containing protein [Candidatus Limnocylindria bacterium]|nr:DUF2723 domain-containing protein [Candidatus Limnocylindria bacterium]